MRNKGIKLFTILLLLLSACGNNDISEEQTRIYDGFKESLLNNGELVSSNIPFDYHIDVKEKGDKYLYEVTIDHPRIAMKSIQMLVLNPEDLSTDYISSSKGIFDEKTYHMIPNQENTIDGYMKSLSLEGVSSQKDFKVFAMVSWKDGNGLNQTQAYFSFNVVNMEDVKAGSRS